jgi:hypothetical protein
MKDYGQAKYSGKKDQRNGITNPFNLNKKISII